jgi:hypothetical protein
MWLKDNIPDKVDIEWFKQGGGFIPSKHAPARRFNAGEKLVFWDPAFDLQWRSPPEIGARTSQPNLIVGAPAHAAAVVMPAKAGIQYAPASRKCPAFTGFRLSLPCVRSAGMTEKGVNGQQLFALARPRAERAVDGSTPMRKRAPLKLL